MALLAQGFQFEKRIFQTQKFQFNCSLLAKTQAHQEIVDI